MFDVVTIGTATRDVFVTSSLFKVLRDTKHLKKIGFSTGEAQCFALGSKIAIEKPVATIGGGATNAAVTFARSGFATGAVVKIGDDLPGTLVSQELKKNKVTSIARIDKRKGTAYSVILLSPGGERTIITYRGASLDLRETDVGPRALRTRSTYIVPGQIPFSVIKTLVHRLKNKGAFVAMNPSKHYIKMGARRLQPILAKLDVIILNREEASYLTGKPYGQERAIFKKFDDIVPGLAVMTEGPKGVTVSDGKTLYRAGIYRERYVKDRTGAGDAFGSGFVTGFISKTKSLHPASSVMNSEAIQHAIKFGSANATSVVEHIGAQTGILSRREFQSQSRWKRLKITSRPI